MRYTAIICLSADLLHIPLRPVAFPLHLWKLASVMAADEAGLLMQNMSEHGRT